jgi:hypothetical protein
MALADDRGIRLIGRATGISGAHSILVGCYESIDVAPTVWITLTICSQPLNPNRAQEASSTESG